MSEENKKSYNINDDELGNVNGSISEGSFKYFPGQQFREDRSKGVYYIYTINYPVIVGNHYEYCVDLDTYYKNEKLGATEKEARIIDIEAWLKAGIIKQVQ